MTKNINNLSVGKKLNDVKPFISQNELALDLGANIGDVTNQLASLGAEVYAFEPNPFAFQKLQRRFSDNIKVKCFNKAVLDKEEKVSLYFHENSDEDEIVWSVGSSLLAFKKNVNQKKNVLVETIDLAKWIFDFDRKIDLIKMDIEGVECLVINHLIDTGAIERVKMMLVETHDHKIPELKRETNLLRRRIIQEGLQEKINLDWV
ncbi:MAG: FkbM family methyltransferase [Cyclobacteriaceae bacterium]